MFAKDVYNANFVIFVLLWLVFAKYDIDVTSWLLYIFMYMKNDDDDRNAVINYTTAKLFAVLTMKIDDEVVFDYRNYDVA